MDKQKAESGKTIPDPKNIEGTQGIVKVYF
jgi:hypothetical protein